MKSVLLIIFIAITCADVKAQVIDYSLDESYDNTNYLERGSVNDILLLPDNNFIVTGMFTSTNFGAQETSLMSENGVLITGYGNAVPQLKSYLGAYLFYGNGVIRRWVPGNPELAQTFRFEFKKPPYSGALGHGALDVMIQENNNILVAGRFNTDSMLIGTSIEFQGLRQLCLIDSTGSPVLDFPMVHCAQPVDAEIYSVDILSNGQYIIAGIFDEVNGYPYKNIARLNADFSVDTTFSNQLLSILASTVLIDSQDRIWLACSFGGSFESNPDSTFLYTRLLPSGEPDPAFEGPLLQTLVGPNEDILYDVPPYDIIEDDDGTFIIGGYFAYADGDYHKTLLKVQDDGSIIDGAFANLGADSTVWGAWEPPLGQVIGTQITNILKLPDGGLLIGGRFSSFGGEPYNCLVKLKPDGFVGIDEKPSQSKLILYPNPSNNRVRIHLPFSNQKVDQVFVYDIKGVLVKKIGFMGIEGDIDISDLQKGIYILHVHANSAFFIEKLIVY